MRYRFLLGCLILSGFAGLAYELLWVRLLALSFGSTATSFSTVLAVFFGGLAIGSLVGGRIARRVSRPVRGYALLELGTGLAALLMYPLLVGLESGFAHLDPGPGALGVALRFTVACLILLVPTVLMGATVPFVTRAMIGRDEDVGRVTALIYAFNTLGACTGAYVTTFWALPYLGVMWSTMVTVAVNLAVFGIASFLGRDEEVLPTNVKTPKSNAQQVNDDSKLKVVGTTIAAMLGFAAVALQVVWVRIFATAMEGTVYGTGSVLIAVLVGIGLGSLLLAPFLKRSPRAGLVFVALQIVGLGLVLLQFRLLPWLSYELGALQVLGLGTYGLHLQMVIVVLAVLGPSVCSGASLPMIVGIVEARASGSARTVGNVYAANTIGAIAGSLVTGFLVLPSAGSEASVLLAVMSIGAASAFGALFFVEGARPLRLVLVPAGLLLVAIYDGYAVQTLASGPAPGSFAQWMQRAQKTNRDTLLFSEGKSANVRVVERRGVRSLTLNALGQGARSVQPPHLIVESLMMAVVPLAHAQKKDNALLVGLGAGVTVDAMLKLGVEHVRVVELERKVVDAVGVIFGDEDPLKSDRVDVEIDDARQFLNAERIRGERRYDVIASMPAHPWVASPIFTQEFFEIAKGALSERGVLCSWFGLGKMNRETTESLLRAFTTVFDHYVIYYLNQNGAYYLVGSPSPIEVSRERYTQLFSDPTIKAHPVLRDDLFLPLQVVATSNAPGSNPHRPGPINTDDRPLVEMLSPTTTATKAVAGRSFFEKLGIDPQMIPATERAEFISSLIEAMLGTPDGKLALHQKRANAKVAGNLLSRGRSALSDARQAYFDVRIAIAERPSDPALSARIDALAPEYQARAQKAQAWSLPPYSDARARALSEAPADTGVIFHHLQESGLVALERVAESAPSVDDDPLGWWMWQLAHTDKLDDAVRSKVTELVGPALGISMNPPLLKASVALLSRSEWPALARTVEEWAEGADKARLAAHQQEGLKAHKQRRFSAAARHLWTAFMASPTTVNIRMPLAESLVATGDEAKVNSLRRALKFQRLSGEQVDHLFEEAKRRLSAGASPATRSPLSAPSQPGLRMTNSISSNPPT